MFERIKLLFPWYRGLKEAEAECARLRADKYFSTRVLNEVMCKLADSDAQVHELAEANRQLINRAKRYREQMREHGIEPRMETTRGPGEPERLGTSKPAPLPDGLVEISAKSLRVDRHKNKRK